MYNAASDSGVIMTMDANNTEEKLSLHRAERPTGPWVPDGLDLHQNMSLTYYYFYQNHNWTAFDNNGHDIICITRFGTNNDSAGYSSTLKTMILGDAQAFRSGSQGCRPQIHPRHYR